MAGGVTAGEGVSEIGETRRMGSLLNEDVEGIFGPDDGHFEPELAKPFSEL